MSTIRGLNEDAIRQVVQDVLTRLGEQGMPKASPGPQIRVGGSTATSGKHGVFATADEACAAAADAFHELRKQGLAGRSKIVDAVKGLCTAKAQEWGKLELDETQIGRLDHKIQKLEGIKNIPGVEWLKPYGMSGDHGITMEENTPFGVVGAITPVTHSIPTIACNIINMVAAGNTVVFNAHPGGARCGASAVAEFNRAIERETGLSNVVTIVEQPSLDSFNAICKNGDVNLLCVTGGPGVVEAAMQSGKRAICAGPGNPPVLVDETARLDRAARDIILGGAYDNNLLCIGEKQIFVVDAVYSQFIKAFKEAGAQQLNSSQLERLTQVAFTTAADAGGCSHPVLNRDMVGVDPSVLAEHAGVNIPANTQLLFAETGEDHPFVIEEQMMPLVPVIRVKDVEDGIRAAKTSEHGYKHSSMIHSLNIEHMTAMARALDSTLFVKNGPCVAGLGSGGEGYASFSVATTTGEGITTPMTFTRRRRCVMVDNLQIF